MALQYESINSFQYYYLRHRSYLFVDLLRWRGYVQLRQRVFCIVFALASNSDPVNYVRYHPLCFQLLLLLVLHFFKVRVYHIVFRPTRTACAFRTGATAESRFRASWTSCTRTP